MGSDPDLCAPMDAKEMGPFDYSESPLGYSWTGTSCEAIWYGCQGKDCNDLYPLESDCLSDRAPSCLASPACLGLDYEECIERAECRVELYGGGCLNLDDCSWDMPQGDHWVCWEQGIACLPADHVCTQRSRADCAGECYWWEHEQEGCFEGCCVTESYGYCAPIFRRGAQCDPQDIGFCPDNCETVVGYKWDGAFCRPVDCCCTGSHCDGMYPNLEACVEDRMHCTENECALQGGYCDYGDVVPPTCATGYKCDDLLVQNEPGVCGLGVCCTPCPEEGESGIW